MRHSTTRLYDPPRGVSISGLSYDCAAGHDVPEHAHSSDQLIFGTRGLMHVTAGRRLWLVPPQFAVWIPAGLFHQIHMRGCVSMRTLYLRPRLAFGRLSSAMIVQVTPLFKELIVETTRIAVLHDRVARHRSLRDLLVSELRSARRLVASVPLPRDARTASVARLAIEQQQSDVQLSALCRHAGASVRTIQRLFMRELGLSFESWRRQMRLMKGIELLASGYSVKETAYRVGYRRASTFVEMFRRTMSITPAKWASTTLESVTHRTAAARHHLSEC